MNGSLPATISTASRQPGGNGHAQTQGASAGNGTEHFIDLLRTLADPIRLRIVRLLESTSQPSSRPSGRKATPPSESATSGISVGELAEILKLPQSTVSRHLKTLTDAGIADARRDGTSTFYRLSEAPVGGAESTLDQLRQMARTHLDHDPQAKSDAHRLASILRKREPANGDFFGKHAPHWDQIRAEWFGDTFHLEGMLALLNPAWTVADIGTGTGAMLPLLSPHVKQIIAVDPSSAMLKGARNRVKECHLENVDIRQGSAEALPIDAHAVDVALLTLVLAYTENPAAVIKDVRRILKPGGIILILDLQPHHVDLFREKLGHRNMGFAEEQLSAWLKDAGFTAIRWHPLSPEKGRSKESATPIPDLFALRAQREVTP